MHRPYEISQSWQRTKYDPEKRKWEMKPIFYVKQTQDGKSKRVSFDQGLEFIRQGLIISNDLSAWLHENDYSELVNS